MFCLLHIVENMFADNYKKNHKEHAAGEYPIVRGRGLGSKRTPGILIRVNDFIQRYVRSCIPLNEGNRSLVMAQIKILMIYGGTFRLYQLLKE